MYENTLTERNKSQNDRSKHRTHLAQNASYRLIYCLEPTIKCNG